MYTKEQLSQYPYFEKLLETTELKFLLDPLTGIVSREYILGFAKSLIAEGTPFTFAVLDLDNFKFVNDTYGHKAGDQVLLSVAESLADYIAGVGIAGRFGGDELLLIHLNIRAYNEKKKFLEALYLSERVIRRNIAVDGGTPFVTGTVGCTTYPDDAQDYDGLFGIMDKVLYRGKTKGRNCYIIYVEEKHKDIVISHIARHGIYTSMHSLIRQIELVPGTLNKLHSVLPFLMQELRISDLYYVGTDRRIHSVRNQEIDEDVSDIANLTGDDLFTTNQIEELKDLCPVFYGVLEKWEIETALIMRVGKDLSTHGYLVLAEPRSHRIWQEEECALLYFLAKLLAYQNVPELGKEER